MRSAFLYSPYDIGASAGEGIDVIHVSCLPYLCGEPLPEKADRPYRLLLSFPFISKGRAYRLFCERFREFADRFDGFTLQNIGDYGMLSDLLSGSGLSRERFFIAGDVSLNITNAETALFWQNKLDSAAILPELQPEEQAALAARFPKGLIPEIIASSKTIVMRSEHCYAARESGFGCGRCGKTGLSGGSLFDIGGREFPIITNPLDCNSLLLAPVESPDLLSEAGDIGLSKDRVIARVR